MGVRGWIDKSYDPVATRGTTLPKVGPQSRRNSIWELDEGNSNGDFLARRL